MLDVTENLLSLLAMKGGKEQSSRIRRPPSGAHQDVHHHRMIPLSWNPIVQQSLPLSFPGRAWEQVQRLCPPGRLLGSIASPGSSDDALSRGIWKVFPSQEEFILSPETGIAPRRPGLLPGRPRYSIRTSWDPAGAAWSLPGGPRSRIRSDFGRTRECLSRPLARTSSRGGE